MVQKQVKDLVNDSEIVDDVVEVDKILAKDEKLEGANGEKVDDEKSIKLKNDDTENKEKGKKVTKPLTQTPRLPSPFPHRVKKKIKDGKFNKFVFFHASAVVDEYPTSESS